MHGLTVSLQALVAASIFFVWVVRYDNLIQEFKQYGLPDRLRDLVGILKMTFSPLLLLLTSHFAARSEPGGFAGITSTLSTRWPSMSRISKT